MGRKFFILVAFCIAMFAAILAGYWDMLDTEKLRAVREQANGTVAELSRQNPSVPGPRPETPPAAASPALPAPAGTGAIPAPAGGTAERQASIETPDGSPSATGAVDPMPPGPVAAPATSADTAPVAGRRPPSFDVLRVEPDGSAVLAGRAAPDTDVRLVDGGRVIGSARTSPTGDFAIVLEEPLPTGDHQIRIEAGRGEGASVSEETAIVSVPEPGRGEELLAMVEGPNQPSRIISLPKQETAPEATAGREAPPQPSTSTGQAAGERSAALIAPTPAVPPSATAGPAPSELAVEAVEIENGTVYIAGRAPGRDTVRVYIDDTLVGQDASRKDGRFLVTAKTDLVAGEHRIRADMVGADGRVASRVEVPFAKPEGDAMSAVASNAAPSPSRLGRPLPDAEADATASSDPSLPGAAPREDAGARSSSGVSGEAAAPDVAAVTPEIAADMPSEVATIRQPALETVKARVLIRRGDTLWRISRDTYGQGRRYTVIYLANGDQIRNPDRIYPGQVFRLPEHGPGAATAAN